jgi:hypothetical protein
LAAHVLEFLGWTPVNVKLLLPPRQSRGNSPYIRFHRRSVGFSASTKTILPLEQERFQMRFQIHRRRTPLDRPDCRQEEGAEYR